MSVINPKALAAHAVTLTKRAMGRFSHSELKRGMFSVEAFVEVNFSCCPPETRAQIVAKVKSSVFYKNRMATA